MTRTFLKKKFTLKKCLWSEIEVYTYSSNIKGDSTISKLHLATINIPLEGKTKGICDCSQ